MNIKPNELRIGNLLLLGNKVISIKSINDDGDIDYVYQSEDETVYVRNLCDENLVGIVLSRSIVSDFGFKKRFKENSSNLWDIDKYSLITKDFDNAGQGFFCLADFMKDKRHWLDLQSRKRMQFAHELQNLFYAITGQELKFISNEKQ